MEKLTYRQAYDKIIDAYFKDEIEPEKANFCFCGTLSPNMYWRSRIGGDSLYPYSKEEYIEMERALFAPFYPYVILSNIGYTTYKDCSMTDISQTPNYEDRLFEGMCKALEVLKQIHRDRGEDVDEVPGLTKRTLAPII